MDPPPRESGPRSGTPGSAARALRDGCAAIRSAWQQSVRSAASSPQRASASGGSAIDEEGTGIILGIASALENHPEAASRAFARYAGRQLAAGAELQSVIRDYGLLRRVVLRHLDGAGALIGPDAQRIDAVIDEAIEAALARSSADSARLIRGIDAVTTIALQSRGTGEQVRDILGRLLTVLVENTSAVDTAAVLTPDGDLLQVIASAGIDEAVAGQVPVRIGEGFAGRIATTRKPAFTTFGGDDGLVHKEVAARLHLKALYGVPLIDEAELLGVAVIASSTAHEFSRLDQLFFQVIVHRAKALLLQARSAQRERDARALSDRASALVQTFFESSPVGLAFLDTDLRYVRINAALARVNGRSVEAHLGKTIHQILEPKLAAAVEAICRQVIDTGVAREQFEVTGRPARADSEHTWIASFYPVRAAGEGLLGIGVTMAEITETKRAAQALRESELRFRMALHNSSVVVFEVDAELRYRWIFNPHLHRPEEVVGKTSFEVFPDREQAERLTELLRMVLATGEPQTAEMALSNKGRTVDYNMELEPVRDERGNITGVIGASADITERKRAEEEMKRAAKFRDQFIGVLGHDLRNPLNAIKASTHLLLRHSDVSETQARSVRRISNSTDKMARMISDILDFARGQLGGGIPIQRQPVDLGEVASHAVEELHLANPERTIELETDGELRGQWDPDRVAQVVGNLVSNALRHGDPHAPVRVWVREAGGDVELSVHNEGPPIPEADLPVLFEPFHHSSVPRTTGGVGLGLFIVSQIARAHGAQIEVRSRQGEGTTFTVRWPRALEAHPEAAAV